LTKDENCGKFTADGENELENDMNESAENTLFRVMHKLICSVQTYDWGKPGSRSTVAALVKEGHHANYVDDNKPYAEFWMGVHKNGPAKIEQTSEDLLNCIKNHPEMVGKHEQGTLQFLFKVLSVEKALSIQSHPTKKLLDSNEAIAKQTLKKIFTKVWASSPEAIAKAVQAFVARIKKDPKNKLDELILRLDSAYPGGDVGVFAPLLLNYFTLKPGQATFLGPNQPHAYLSGGSCLIC
uniref:Phosphohexomutase n=1 Tax=Haemonchus placei TaxID=6290 RepID=A0A0N4X8A4_HAEPC